MSDVGTNGDSLHSLVLRPGPGWTQLNAFVWEHDSGMRIHWSCPIVRLPDMTMPSIWPDRKRLNLLIRVNGGNRKRGVMAYAMTIMQNGKDDTPK